MPARAAPGAAVAASEPPGDPRPRAGVALAGGRRAHCARRGPPHRIGLPPLPRRRATRPTSPSTSSAPTTRTARTRARPRPAPCWHRGTRPPPARGRADATYIGLESVVLVDDDGRVPRRATGDRRVARRAVHRPGPGRDRRRGVSPIPRQRTRWSSTAASPSRRLPRRLDGPPGRVPAQRRHGRRPAELEPVARTDAASSASASSPTRSSATTSTAAAGCSPPPPSPSATVGWPGRTSGTASGSPPAPASTRPSPPTSPCSGPISRSTSSAPTCSSTGSSGPSGRSWWPSPPSASRRRSPPSPSEPSAPCASSAPAVTGVPCGPSG